LKAFNNMVGRERFERSTSGLKSLIQSNPCYAVQAIAMYYKDKKDFDPDRRWKEKFSKYNTSRYIDYGNTHWDCNKKQ
jgi:hypothetical protein